MDPIPVRVVVLAATLACCACSGAAVPPPAAKTAERSTVAAAPTIEELKNATFTGLDGQLGPVTLANGRWTGAPPEPGAASRPIVELADGFRVVGDLDGDGVDEAVVALAQSHGGTATFMFLAVVARKEGIPRNVATTALGDRVQLRSGRIDGGRLFVNAVRAGVNDAACCPRDVVDWQWTLADGRLQVVDPH